MSMQWVDDIQLTVKQYFPTLLLAVFAAAAVIQFITMDDKFGTDYIFIYIKRIYCLLFAVGLTFAGAMFEQRIGKFRFLCQFLAILLTIILYVYLPSSGEFVTAWHENFLELLFLIMLLLTSLSPFIRKPDSIAFWSYNSNLFHNAGYSILFIAAMCAGLALAMGALESLFGIDFEFQTYPKVLLTIAIIGGAYIALMLTKGGLSYLEMSQNFQAITRFIVQYIQIPLMLIYAVIIFAYGIKILLTWNLPQGWISAMILVYSFLAILAFLLIYPLRNTAEKSWVVFFSRVIFISIVAMLPLLLIAILTRIHEYGFTGTRYLGLMVAIWLLIIGLYFSLKKAPDIRVFPFSLLVLILFSLWMPKLNYYTVSMNSQAAQLEQRFKEIGVSIENPLKMDDSVQVPYEFKRSIESIINYFDDYGQSHRYFSFFSFELPQKNDCCKKDNVRKILDNSLEISNNEKNKGNTLYRKNPFIKLDDGSLLILEQYQNEFTLKAEDTGFSKDYRIRRDDTFIELMDQDNRVLTDEHFRRFLDESYNLTTDSDYLNNEQMKYSLALGDLMVVIYFTQINRNSVRDGYYNTRYVLRVWEKQ